MKNFSFSRHRLEIFCLIFSALPLAIQAQSQPHKVTGTVSDNTMALPGVSIVIKNSNNGTISNEKGEYAINAKPTDTLVFSFIGYKTQYVVVNSQTTINVTLQDDATQLQEVKVNAGYYSVKEKERTGSIAKIGAADIEKQPVTNVLAAMQGRLAGVNIIQNTGVSGGGFDIQIRGQNSIRSDGNNPLYIIDGVPYSSEPIGNGMSMSIMPALTNPLNNINPQDIESVEVLKDADATAIYGSRGANGVVLITTKKGKKGQTRFSTTFSQGVGVVPHFMELMNTQQYLAMRAEGFANDGITAYPANAYDINGTWDQNRYTNWQEELIGGKSKIMNFKGAVSGGSEQTQFLISTNLGSETTVFPGDFGYKKSSIRANLGHASADKKVKLSFSAGYTIQNNNQPAADLTTASWTLAPNAPALYDAQGNLNWENNTFENPLARLNGIAKSKTYDFIANGVLSYLLLPQLEFKTSFGYTDLDHHESSTSPSTQYNPSYGYTSESSSIFYTDTARESWIIEPQLNWKSVWGALKTDVLLGSTFQCQNNNLLGMAGFGFSSNSLIYNPAAATTSEVMSFDASEYKYQSFFGRVNFAYKERYIVNITGRRDGSSRFGSNNRFAWFGAIGGAWVFSKEALLVDSNILSFGKIRGSYGITGNDQIGNYQYLNTFSAGATAYDGAIGLQPTRLYNAGFGWETNKKLELALETGFLKDRLFFTVAWYKNRSSDQLVGVPLPGTTGFTQIQSNLNATVQNSGTEWTLRTLNFQQKSFSWSTSLNVSVAKNKLVSFPNLESSTYNSLYVIGQPLNIERVYHYTGINPVTGIYTFEDVNGDGLLTDAEDKVFTKDLNPSFFGGLQNSLKYKGLQLDFLFQFVKQDNYNIPAGIGVAGTMTNQPTMLLQHWQQNGDTGPYQLYTSGENAAAVQALYRYAASNAAITDASYVRLKNVSLSFDIPESWLQKVRCQAILEGQNLLTFTPYEGPDPEFKGIGVLPPLRVFTAGLQFNF